MPWLPPQWKREHRYGALDSTDAVLTALADLQHGIVGVAQALEVGVTRRELARRRATGHLVRVRPGVLAVGRRRLSPAGVRMAAVLAAGFAARLAGRSGCVQRGLLPDRPGDVDVAIPLARRIRLPGIAERRTDARPGDVSIVDGIPTHAVPRLLLDLAADGSDELERAWREAAFRRTLEAGQIARLLDDFAGAPGTPALRALYERRLELRGQLMSEFERLMLPIVREAGLPEPLCNERWTLDGVTLRPDFRFPELRLVIEADGREGHDFPEAFADDAARDALYAAHEHECLRYGWWEARHERSRVLAELRQWKQAHRSGALVSTELTSRR